MEARWRVTPGSWHEDSTVRGRLDWDSAIWLSCPPSEGLPSALDVVRAA